MFCTWLIGSGFSKRKLKFKTFEFLKFFSISFVTFGLSAFINIGAARVPSNFVTINGIDIPLGECMAGNGRLIPDFEERMEYCSCFVEKVIEDPVLNSQYQDDLVNNKFHLVFKKIQMDDVLLQYGFDQCMQSVKMEWTDVVEKSMKKSCEKELVGTGFEQTNDIESYCSCLVEGYKAFPLNQLNDEGFNERHEIITIDSLCVESSIK